MTNATNTWPLKTKDPNWFRAVAINDPHFAANNPPAFKVNYLDLVTANVKQALSFASAKQADAVLWGGDMFHLKEPKSNPYSLTAHVIKLLAGSAIHSALLHAGIGGNHDYKFGSLDAGLPGSPLEILVEAGMFSLLDREELLYTTEDGLKVRVAGGSYYHGKAEHVRDKKKLGADYLIALGHFWLGTQTGQFYGEPLYGFDFFKDSEIDHLVVGHHHDDHGVHEAYGKTFNAAGSICVTGTFEHDLTRRPAAVLIEVGRGGSKTTVLRPKMPAADEIFDLQKYEEAKKEKETINQFIESLAGAEINTPDPADILDQLAPPREVRERAHEYITAAETARR